LNSSTWIAAYLPLFIMFFIILPQKREMEKTLIMKIKKKRGALTMTNEVIKKYIGKYCKISTGSFGTNLTGQIIDVNENWLEVETNKGKELINADFIQSIKIKLA
jgi:preprotein translocase subunit YajC